MLVSSPSRSSPISSPHVTPQAGSTTNIHVMTTRGKEGIFKSKAAVFEFEVLVFLGGDGARICELLGEGFLWAAGFCLLGACFLLFPDVDAAHRLSPSTVLTLWVALTYNRRRGGCFLVENCRFGVSIPHLLVFGLVCGGIGSVSSLFCVF
ncbi:hypothetical protein LIER_40486 [Lithospermum erythrorhizon]|uniref:Uncharacterized protein n=1 Tax=Lithospermum erythrorhizon TaxID=34254 RepID=A0AAV3QYJ2_LITER